MVDVRWRDIVAGQSEGCQCYLIDHGYLQESPIHPIQRYAHLLKLHS